LGKTLPNRICCWWRWGKCVCRRFGWSEEVVEDSNGQPEGNSAIQAVAGAIWGTNDVLLVPAGAEAYRRDNPNPTVGWDTGHFALETHVEEIAKAMHEVLGRVGRQKDARNEAGTCVGGPPRKAVP
jgi:hypothetical protein